MESLFGFVRSFDTAVILSMDAYFSSPAVQVFFNIPTLFGYFASGWIVVFLVIGLKKKERFFWFFWGLAFVLTFLVTDVALKNLVARPRPFVVLPELTIATIRTASYSFPSSHAAFSGVSFYIFSKIDKNRSVLGGVFALSLLVSLSRLILKVHFPSDIIAGYLLGLGTGYLSYALTVRCFAFTG